MLPAVKGSAELFKLAVVLGQLKRALHIEAAADFKERLFNIAVLDFDGFAFENAVVFDDAAPEAVFLHGEFSLPRRRNCAIIQLDTLNCNGWRGICKVMRLTLCPLVSGSSGNSIYISCGGVRLLVDAGVSAARIEANLREIGVDIRDIDGLLITHEHVDHIRGIGVLCRKYGIPVYANEGTWQGIFLKETHIPARCVRTFFTGEDFYIGGMNINPFPIPHDANEPVGFAFNARGLRCAVATDIGHINKTWMNAVSGCQALVLEANHDIEMVERGPYPKRLQNRILGRNGHLNNVDCAKALLELAKHGARAVSLAHLSADNNLPELAYNTVCEALWEAGLTVGEDISVSVARRDRVSDMLIVSGDEDNAG